MLKCNKQGRFMIQIPVRHPSHYVPYYIYNNCALIFWHFKTETGRKRVFFTLKYTFFGSIRHFLTKMKHIETKKKYF